MSGVSARVPVLAAYCIYLNMENIVALLRHVEHGVAL
jgi:hypothetical protein